MKSEEHQDPTGFEIAVVGMAGRFPGAVNLDQYWANIRDGVESIRSYSVEEMAVFSGSDAGVEMSVLSPKAGVTRAEILGQEDFVRAHGAVDDVDLFDAAFFSFNPREAQVLNPQHRLLLEVAWEALESAGYDPERYPGAIGVFAGESANFYMEINILNNRDVFESSGFYQAGLMNSKDSLATMVSYKMNLQGPSFSVQAHCATSIVAIHTACQSLLAGECDMAMAGGVAVTLPSARGYNYQEGMILSPDGHCRTFDAAARGTVPGDGAGIVVLKRLSDALESRDTVHAFIRGFALNNDGSDKISFTAPGVEGQERVIEEALKVSATDPGTIQFVEAHGTGTQLGDPIEFSALSRAFGKENQRKNYCALGSVKPNIGHTDTCAGVASFIKAILVMKHRTLPPIVHYQTPNPELELDDSPFYIPTTAQPWPQSDGPMRASVSCFGMGGTNGHFVLEEPPVGEIASSGRGFHLLPVSTRTEKVLEQATGQLADHLAGLPSEDLADVAHTLQMGRKQFGHRRAVVCSDPAAAAAAFRGEDAKSLLAGSTAAEPTLVFMFPGQGAQYVGMARELYDSQPVFRRELDRCVELLTPHLGLDLREVLYPEDLESSDSAERLKQTEVAQPALFAIEYALAQLWMDWGLMPDVVIGHSIGEYTAACLAGVFSLEDAAALVAARGSLMQSLPPGDMLSVPMPAGEVEPLLDESLSVAAVNAPQLSVVAGPAPAVEALRSRLAEQGIEARVLETSHAFHSAMMDPILDSFREHLRGVALNEPRIRFVSTVTGDWISAEAQDPEHWVRNIRQAVRFADGVGALLQEKSPILLEVGPGTTLASLARLHPDRPKDLVAQGSLRHPRESKEDERVLLEALGRLWVAGASLDWDRYNEGEERRRVPLPTYPWDRKRFWVYPDDRAAGIALYHGVVDKESVGPFYRPMWRPAPAPGAADLTAGNASYLLFVDQFGLGSELAGRLAAAGAVVRQVRAGDGYQVLDNGDRQVDPRSRANYERLFAELAEAGELPGTIVHLWSVEEPLEFTPGSVEAAQRLGFDSLILMAQGLDGSEIPEKIRLQVISANAQDVTGEETVSPAAAMVSGPCRVIPQELPYVTCSWVDVVFPPRNAAAREELVDQLATEAIEPGAESVVAFRGRHRWVEDYAAVDLPQVEERERIVAGGTYLITGGLGGMGLTFAEHLARVAGARLILTGRSRLPERDEWDAWIAEHGEDDRTSRKLARIRELEDLGAQVLPLSADVSDETSMTAVIEEARRTFGSIDGVIHAAGVTIERPLVELSLEDAAVVMGPKVAGTMILARLLEEDDLNFFFLASSLASIMGAATQVDYCAANAFIDAFAHRRRQLGHRTPTVAVNWDNWREVGMAADFALERGSGDQSRWITPADGADAFDRILARPISQVVMSHNDPRQMRQLMAKFLGATGSEEEQDAPSRDELSTTYQAPEGEVQEVVAGFWQEMLGIDQVGAEDDFFEMGGHSLLAIQVVSRLKERLGVELSLPDVLEAPTVRELAELIEAAGRPGEGSGLASEDGEEMETIEL